MASPQTKIIAVTTSNASVTFSPVVKVVKIKNLGAVDVYFNIDAAATTSLFPLGPQEEINIGLNGGITTVQAITASSTSTLRIIGVIQW